LEDLDIEVEISSDWETIRENIKISARDSLGYFELKKHKPWFDEECSKLLDQRKQSKMQWLQDANEINRDNLNNVRCETSKHFSSKKGNTRNTKLITLQRTVRRKTSGTFIEE
jgi:hypothetical protein